MTVNITSVVVVCFKLYMLETLFLYSLTLALFLFGISNDVRNISHLTIFFSITIGFLILVKSKAKLRIPNHFGLLLVFAVILQVYLFFVKPVLLPFYYALLFAEGTLVWFLIYNLENKIVRKLYKFIFFLGIIYFLLYFFSLTFNIGLTKLASLFFIDSEHAGHMQIGNFWTLVLMIVIGNKMSYGDYLTTNILKLEIIYYSIGAYLLFISKSRTAYLSILIVLVYIFCQKIINKKIVYVALLLMALLIIYTSFGRSLLFSRPYFLQSVIGFFHHPLGVGMGNFRIISEYFYKNGGILGSFSDSTHNIFLEAISGVGVLSLPLIYWGVKIISDLKYKHLDMVWVCVFVSLSTMILIDLSYTIPSMFLLWFVSLAMVQRSAKV